ncbi:MAG: hypothetical protein A2X35_06400 [Elusimicrobia bacterium GWA2_61_42]|nr:MAG: hypothetical protein A2X35_06400 [Elusimicrobia bacterium GWA2_61_42]OGR78781.1 MAG: hypothetical protein A2X38_04345 [Elusimicrobia bacterium GWC2_61_25]
MLIKNLSFILLGFSLLTSAALPAAADQDTRQSTELIGETSAPLTAAEARAFFAGPAKDDRVLVVPAAMIVIAGAKVWKVIINNRPSADLATAYASAIPSFSFNWGDLQGWRKVTKKYRFAIDTKLQGRAVDIVYEVSFFHGAIPASKTPFREGHYITNFTVKPQSIDLKWGWKVSLETAISDPMNVGTGAAPVAWLKADLKWRYAKPLEDKPKIGLESLSVDGLGRLTEFNTGALSVSPVPVEESRELPPAVNWD